MAAVQTGALAPGPDHQQQQNVDVTNFVVDSSTSTKNHVISTNVLIHLTFRLLVICLSHVRLPGDDLKKTTHFEVLVTVCGSVNCNICAFVGIIH
jgi:hypothetical protein